MAFITHQRLREALSYSPVVGVFEWRIAGRRIRKGFLAGSVGSGGYVRIRIDGKTYQAHRLAWLYMTGDWPDCQIDHVDGDRSNNAFNNLRPATQLENSCNMKRTIANTSGEKGVFFCRNSCKWWAVIRMRGKYVFRRSFASLDEASDAIRAARKALHGDFANDGRHGFVKEDAEQSLDLE